jgi:hypothetical protein
MERRKIADEAEARRALRVIDRKGMTIREWARTSGVDGRSLHAWQMAFARRGKRAKPALVELVPATKVMTETRYVIRLGDAALEFGDDANEAMLRRVVAVLRSC